MAPFFICYYVSENDEEGKGMNHLNRNEETDSLPKKPAVAMAYVPWQWFTNAYDPQKAFMAGTIFPELDKPFIGRPGGMRR